MSTFTARIYKHTKSVTHKTPFYELQDDSSVTIIDLMPSVEAIKSELATMGLMMGQPGAIRGDQFNMQYTEVNVYEANSPLAEGEIIYL